MSIERTQTATAPIDVQQLVTAHRCGTIAPKSAASGSPVEGTKPGEVAAFGDLLRTKVEGLKFSAHATSRIKSRNIAMTPDVMGKLEKAVSGAAVKGARDSLILMRDLAFIVNIPNRTVVTAMDGESIRDNVFTNIDSTVLAD